MDHENDAQVLCIPMFEGGSEGSGFHIRNNLQSPYNRADAIQRTGPIDIRCELTDVVHGAMSAESSCWATIMLFEFRFDPQKEARRICRATIKLTFNVSNLNNTLPEVEAISFDGNYSYRPTKQSETTATSYGASIGFSTLVDASTSANWEKNISKYTTDTTVVSGGKHVLNNRLPNRVAKWTLLENSTAKKGIPTSIHVAVRVRRDDEAEFTCMPELECRCDFMTSLENFFSRVPKDDHIKLKPGLNSGNKLLDADPQELGSVDLQQFSRVGFSEEVADAQM